MNTHAEETGSGKFKGNYLVNQNQNSSKKISSQNMLT